MRAYRVQKSKSPKSPKIVHIGCVCTCWCVLQCVQCIQCVHPSQIQELQELLPKNDIFDIYSTDLQYRSRSTAVYTAVPVLNLVCHVY